VRDHGILDNGELVAKRSRRQAMIRNSLFGGILQRITPCFANSLSPGLVNKDGAGAPIAGSLQDGRRHAALEDGVRRPEGKPIWPRDSKWGRRFRMFGNAQRRLDRP